MFHPCLLLERNHYKAIEGKLQVGEILEYWSKNFLLFYNIKQLWYINVLYCKEKQQMGLILAIIATVSVLALEIVGPRLNWSFMRWMRQREHQFGSKLLAAFLCGFIVFTLFSAKMPNAWQKVPVIIVCLLLIWANLFLVKKISE
jgi:hypothetical protein